jgi:nuclear pore complex protein Nup93
LDSSPTAFATQILTRAARQSEREKRTTEAIRLYHLAGEHETVVECLARALGDQISEPVGGGGDDEGLIETAREVLQHYERTNKAGGKAREAVSKLVRIRDARVAKDQGMPERALEVRFNSYCAADGYSCT